MSMIQEFKEFAMKGNVVDLAVGVIIGAAFGKIVESLVGDIFMPIVGALVGGLDFSNYFVGLSSAVNSPSLLDAKKQGAVLAYGSFMTIMINFLIVAFIMFLVIKAMNRMKKKEEAKPAPVAEVPADVKLLSEIRDILSSSSSRANPTV